MTWLGVTWLELATASEGPATGAQRVCEHIARTLSIEISVAMVVKYRIAPAFGAEMVSERMACVRRNSDAKSLAPALAMCTADVRSNVVSGEVGGIDRPSALL